MLYYGVMAHATEQSRARARGKQGVRDKEGQSGADFLRRQRSQKDKEMNLRPSGGKSNPIKGDSQCKVPEVGVCLAYVRTKRKGPDKHGT